MPSVHTRPPTSGAGQWNSLTKGALEFEINKVRLFAEDYFTFYFILFCTWNERHRWQNFVYAIQETFLSPNCDIKRLIAVGICELWVKRECIVKAQEQEECFKPKRANNESLEEKKKEKCNSLILEALASLSRIVAAFQSVRFHVQGFLKND